MSPAPYEALLEPLAIAGGAVGQLGRYLERLDRWSARINLSAARTPAERVAMLVAPVAPWAEKMLPGRLLDVGSGNGSPGLVLALLRPDLATTLLEPRSRRWAFLREAARACGRDDIIVRRERLEQSGVEVAENVTIRALALPLADLEAHVAPGGQLVVWGEPTVGRAAALTGPETETVGGFRVHRYRRDVSRETSPQVSHE